MPNITPAARVTSTTIPGAAKEATRFFGRFDGPLNVTMDATGSGGRSSERSRSTPSSRR